MRPRAKVRDHLRMQPGCRLWLRIWSVDIRIMILMDHITADQKAESAAPDDVGQEVISSGISRHADSGRRSKRSVFCPRITLVFVCNDGGDRPNTRRMTRRKRITSVPELRAPVVNVRP